MRHIFRGVALLHVVVVLFVLVGLFLGVGALQKHASFMSGNSALYCSPDGTLSSIKSIQSHRSYCLNLVTDTNSIQAGKPFTLSFSIVDDEGATLKSFEVEHQKLLHLIMVRNDLQHFQHLHPELDTNTGVFTLSNVTFPEAGPYKLYADFVTPFSQMGPDGSRLNAVVMSDVVMPGAYAPQRVQTGEATKNVEGYSVTFATDPKALEGESMAMFSFTIKKDGRAVTDLQPYLGALGHAVVLREGTLEYIHAHAVQRPTDKQNGTIDFHVDLPYGGTYKVFTQFQHEGKVVTTDFVVPVSGEGPEAAPVPSAHHMMPDGTMMQN